MNSRQRVLTTLRHQEPDRVPIDLGGMRSTGITAIAYNLLKVYLGMNGQPACVFDIMQQLAEPEQAILQRFGVDVIALNRVELDWGIHNWNWKPWTLPDGSPALVSTEFVPLRDEDDNWLVVDEKGTELARMPAGSYYFDSVHAPLAKAETVEEIEAYEPSVISNEELDFLRRRARNLHETTDYAIMGGFGGNILERGQALRGWGTFMLDLALCPQLAQALMTRLADAWLVDLARYLEAVGEYIHIIQMGDDLGTQQGPQLSPGMYRRLIWPHHRRIYQYVKAHTDLAVFLHSCGSIYDLIPDLIAAGVDILNPVQTSASKMDPATLKREFGAQLVFWGGGCDTQHVLPRARPEQVREHVRERIRIFAPGGGFVFTPVHNIQPDVPPENIVAMFDAAREFGIYPIR
ncbi:MAG: uroporphyrinogen decarboxylase family protein [Chloroflexota bacterium]|nr:methyltransferase [Anaerolineae bacterium]